jgi:hypothetical protein
MSGRGDVPVEAKNVPNPDPSTLTTQQLRHELALLQELIETRLDGYDKANTILADNVNRVPTLLDREILRITQLFNEKFSSSKDEVRNILSAMNTRFAERDERARASETAASTAIAAALAALKEMIGLQNTANAAAIGKSEAGTNKEIDNIKLILANSAKNVEDKIADMRTNRRLDTGSIVGIVLGIAGVVSLVVALVTFALRAHP